MPTIKFSDKELEYLRSSYQAELKAATEYLEEIRRIVAKLGDAKPPTAELTPDHPQESKKKRKRGRPKKRESANSNSLDVKVPAEEKKPGRPKKSNKEGRPKLSAKKHTAKELKSPDSIKEKAAPKAEPKKKAKRRKKSTSRWGGIRLKNLSKPLRTPAPVEIEESIVAKHFDRPEILTDNQ
jgi:hypothetical protein